MILTLNIGNMELTIGCVEEEKIRFTGRIASDQNKTELDYLIHLKMLLELEHMSLDQFEGAILASVVPRLTERVKQAVETLLGCECKVVGPGMKTGLQIRMDNPAQLGTDLVADAVAAIHEYPVPLTVVDMETATVFCVINDKKQYIGSIIMPGVQTALNALSEQASQLREVSLIRPKNLIGTNTAECMQSGIMYGSAAEIDGIIQRLKEELGAALTVVATGLFSEKIIPICKSEIVRDEYLQIKGLKMIYDKNKKR